jgi:3,4-dihydroxy 2-butanone 4-phosphate synthase/GTP cyclohydrolase II
MNKRKIYGTTLYIDKICIETIYGNFTAYTYQNLIHKGYIIALTYGDIKKEILYTRIHSSCVTSETLRSQDCDCVQQLYGAFKKISEKGNGILFYFIQEGRGCGFIGKSRDRMHVQYSDDKINTFDAYKMLGMKKDYRDYTSVKDICYMLDINPKFILMTNNPDKINGLKQLGLNVFDTETIEYIPNLFNRKYLISKQKSGHNLSKLNTFIGNYDVKHKYKCKPFEPYHLKNCTRYIHVSSYYLPIRPIDNKITLTQTEYNDFISKYGKEYPYIDIPNNKRLIKINDEIIKKFPDLSSIPYWFKVNCFFDIATNNDVLILEYGNTRNNPIVRIHSESLLNRFPLVQQDNKKKYKQSINLIIGHGSGIIVLFYEDGRGSGFGGFVLSRNKETTITGIQKDSRDYRGVSHLLKEYINPDKIILLYSCISSQEISRKQFEKVNINIDKYIYIGRGKNKTGCNIIKSRIDKNLEYINHIDNDINLIETSEKKEQLIKAFTNDNVYFTGIGSSESHAKYLMYLIRKYPEIKSKNLEFIPLIEFYDSDRVLNGTLVLFSQGLSPNVQIIFEKYNYQSIILFTAITIHNKNQKKLQILNKLKENNSNFIINFPIEDEYTTLIRIIGPMCGYLYSFKLIKELLNIQLDKKTKDSLYKLYINNEILVPNEKFIGSLVKNRRVCILCDSESKKYIGNIQCKFIEGVFFKAFIVCDYFEFVHGTYQNLEYNRNNGIITDIIILKRNREDIISKLQLMLKDYNIWILENDLRDELKIVHYEISFNYLISQIMNRLDIDQINWFGKETGKLIYDIKN